MQTFDTFFVQLKRLADRVEELGDRLAAVEEFAQSMPSLEPKVRGRNSM